MKDRLIRGAAVVFTAALLLCNDVEASTIIVDAKTGEKYENLDEALEHNVVSEDDISVSIPATKTESDTDYNKADHEDVDVDIQPTLNDETVENRVVDDNNSGNKVTNTESKPKLGTVVIILSVICALIVLAAFINRILKRRK